MKLTESQTESFELLHANICNGLMYAEDLLKHNNMREPMFPVVTKLRWLKAALERRIPASNRGIAKAQDHQFYDELLRSATHMGDEEKNKLEQFINNL